MDDFEACITHLRLPVTHRRATRTTNLLERLFVEERCQLVIHDTMTSRTTKRAGPRGVSSATRPLCRGPRGRRTLRPPCAVVLEQVTCALHLSGLGIMWPAPH